MITTCPPVDGVLAATLDIQATDVAIHPTTGDLYYSDERCDRVRKVRAGIVTSVTTVAGIEPWAAAFASDGTLYVANSAQRPGAQGGVGEQRADRRGRRAAGLRRRRRPGSVRAAGLGHRPRHRHRRQPLHRRPGQHAGAPADPGRRRDHHDGARHGLPDEGPDGLPAAQTAISFPYGVSWDAGRLYVVLGHLGAGGGYGRAGAHLGRLRRPPGRLGRRELGVAGPAPAAVRHRSRRWAPADPRQPARTRCGGSSRRRSPRSRRPARRSPSPPPPPHTAATLSWVPPSNGGSPLTGYTLYIWPIGAVIDIASDQSTR